MKKFLLSLPLLALLTTQCRQDDVPAPTLTQSQPFTLAVGQAVRVQWVGQPFPSYSSYAPLDSLTFKLNVIEDSRCPADADCVRAGEATTKFTLSAYGATSAEQSLSIPVPNAKNHTDSTTVRVGNSSFVVVLKSVKPYPGTGIGNWTKTATFVVK
ncbi:MAG: hypothetical protein H7Y12_07120 [Sphingobacteriaceae bacterium]|nr:hypothetical protein [Cytophagaceae bacterium]